MVTYSFHICGSVGFSISICFPVITLRCLWPANAVQIFSLQFPWASFLSCQVRAAKRSKKVKKDKQSVANIGLTRLSLVCLCWQTVIWSQRVSPVIKRTFSCYWYHRESLEMSTTEYSHCFLICVKLHFCHDLLIWCKFCRPSIIRNFRRSNPGMNVM